MAAVEEVLDDEFDPIPDDDEFIASIDSTPRFQAWLDAPTYEKHGNQRLASITSDYSSADSRRGTLVMEEAWDEDKTDMFKTDWDVYEEVPLHLEDEPQLIKLTMTSLDQSDTHAIDKKSNNKSALSKHLDMSLSEPTETTYSYMDDDMSEASDYSACGRGDVVCEECGESYRPTPMMKRKHKNECKGPKKGTSRFLTPEEAEAVENAGNRSFEMIETIGVGNFGIVKLCALEGVDRPFSIKILSKQQLLQMSKGREVHLAERVSAERKILSTMRHPFVVNLYRSFQTKSYLYMLMDFVPGGEMFYHLRRTRRFPEQMAQFYAAQIVLVLEYLHGMGVAYRDLKTENLLIATNGYLRVIDFGFAKHFNQRSCSFTICGTPEYLAPEIITSRGHSYPVDWWAFGILVYEMLVGVTPFFDEHSETKVYSNVLSGKVPERAPIKQGSAVSDLILELLVADPWARLGSDSAEQVKKHRFFASIDWDDLYYERLPGPLIPELQSAWDCSFFEKYLEDECTLPPPGLLSAEQQAIFEGF